MPINPPQFNTPNYANAMAQGTQNALAQAQLMNVGQQMQQRNALAPLQMQQQQLATAEARAKHVATVIGQAVDQPSYDAGVQSLVSLGADPNSFPKTFSPEVKNNILGKIVEKFGPMQEIPGVPGTYGQQSLTSGKYTNTVTPSSLGSSPALVKTYNLYKKQNPSYKGDILDFQSKMRTAGQPIVNPEATHAFMTSILNGNATLRNVPQKARANVAILLEQQGPNAFSPEAKAKFTRSASLIQQNYVNLPQYKLTANAAPYLARIDAALKTPGSVSDQDLLDSLTKLTTGGNVVTEQQVKLITEGKNFSDRLNVLKNKAVNQGGVLSDNQRQQINTISKEIFNNYQKLWKPINKRLVSQLNAAGIPKQFWSLPDLNQLSAEAGYPMQTQGNMPQVPQQVNIPPQNDKGWKLYKDANGNQAYVGPNGEVEEIK